MFFSQPQSLSCWHPGGLKLTTRALELAKQIAPLSSAKGDTYILDVGCGKGESLHFLRQQGFMAYGVDRDVIACEGNAHVCANANALPFGAHTFHAIICECVLCLMPHKLAVLQELWRVAKDAPAPSLLLLNDIYSINNFSSEEGPYTRQELERQLGIVGWKVHVFEDHSPSLKAYAAQLAWHGACVPQLAKGHFGFGLWVASKEIL